MLSVQAVKELAAPLKTAVTIGQEITTREFQVVAQLAEVQSDCFDADPPLVGDEHNEKHVMAHHNARCDW